MMQKRRKLAVIEYSGAGWYGEVYEVAPNWWAWAAGVEMIDRAVFTGGVGFKTEDMAYSSMMVHVASSQRRQGETILHILANQLGV